MLYYLSYFREAKTDIKEAKKWYKEQKPGLEKRFAEAIKVTTLKIQSRPYSYAVRYKNVRIAHPRVFPYGVHIIINEGEYEIIILAVVHNKRSPDVTSGRT